MSCFCLCAHFLSRVLFFPQPFGLSGPILCDTARPSQRSPSVARYGVFWRLNMPNWARYPLPLFLSVSPLESMRSGGAMPPHKRGISAILARYPMKTRQNACDTPLCDTISKGYCTIWRGILHWAAKLLDGRSVKKFRWLFPFDF